MAELVEFHIEEALPELEQMERIGLFSREEIKKIGHRRRALEYTLRRQKKKKNDVLKYIQYEIHLLDLIGKRRERLRCNFKRQEIDHAIASRINKLFKTVVLRFQDDVSLWLHQIEFCKRMKWHHSISGLFTRMLQVHSSDPALWVMAAKWEMEENNAAENARQLLQRGLRFHPESKELWLAYFRMELIYSDMVRRRKEILGIQDIKLKDDQMTNDAVLDGSIASVVYKNATSTIEDVEFALSFLPICLHFDFTKKHIADIYEDIQLRHPEAEETLDTLAKRELLDINEKIKTGKEKGIKKKAVIAKVEKDIISKYEEAVAKVPTHKMWQFYIDFSLSRLMAAKKVKNQCKLLSEVLHLYQRASEGDHLNSEQCIEWVRLLRRNGETKAALERCLETARKWPQEVPLWHLCLSLHIASKVDTDEIAALFDEALCALKKRNCLQIYELGVQWLSLVNPSKLTEFFEKGLRRSSRKQRYREDSEVVSPLKVLYLEVVALRSDILAARDLFAKLCSMPPVSADLYKKMIFIEKAQVEPSIEKLRKYYEDAIMHFGSKNVDLWLNYMKMEVECGNPGVYGMLHWRAMKALNSEYIDEFVTKVTLFSAGHGLPSISDGYELCK